MGIRRFLLYLRQKTQTNVPLLESLTCESLQYSSVGVDANNYFYKFLATETDCANQIEQIFCILTSGAHDTTALVLINEHLGRCETTSERHLLRCLYVFCYFCHSSLRLRHLLFVIDGAAPHIKTDELADRKQQKRLAYGKVLHERRTLLLHRIYILRWYQIAAITFAIYENYNDLVKTESIHKGAVEKLLQNSFEWALGTEIPEEVFANNMSLLQTFRTENALCDLFSKLRMTVQTSFLVEFDFGNSHFYYLDLFKLFDAFIHAMIKSCREANKQTPRPFLLCLHVNEHQAKVIEPLFVTHRQSLLHCWQSCQSTFLLCTIVHRIGGKSIVGVPPENASELFREWEIKASEYWCNSQIFCHRHQYVWREIKYAEWLCSSKGDEWLRNAYQTSLDRDTYYYQVPKRYSQCYDTENDASHQNLDWIPAARQLFSGSHLQGITSTAQLRKSYFPKSKNVEEEKIEEIFTNTIEAQNSNEMQEDVDNLDESVDVILEQKQKQHQRFRIRDAFLQIVVHFLRVVCGAPVLVAEHEAEATCAKLCRDQLCDFVFTDDVDALAFGSPNIVIDWPDICEIGRWLTLLGGTLPPKFTAKVVRTEVLQRHFELSWEDFTLWCIFCGTDFMRVGESKLSVAMTLRIIRNFSSFEQRVEQLEKKRYIQEGSLQVVQKVYEFFRENQTLPQSEFLTKQFAPISVDETVRLHEICASRKLGKESE